MYNNQLTIRDRLEDISHEYANIDEEIIVSVINDDLAPLKSAIEHLLKKF